MKKIAAPADGVDKIAEEWGRAQPDLDLEAMEITGRIYRLSLLIERYSESICREYGFGFGECDLLLTLRRRGPPYTQRPTDLSQASLVTSGATTGRIDRLAALGLVDRVDSSTDRRATYVHLTHRGWEVTDALIARLLKGTPTHAALLDVSKAEKKKVNSILRLLLRTLEENAELEEAKEPLPGPRAVKRA